MAHESGAHRLLAIDQLSSRPRVPSLRRALSGRPAGARSDLLGPHDQGNGSLHQFSDGVQLRKQNDADTR